MVIFLAKPEEKPLYIFRDTEKFASYFARPLCHAHKLAVKLENVKLGCPDPLTEEHISDICAFSNCMPTDLGFVTDGPPITLDMPSACVLLDRKFPFHHHVTHSK